MITYLRNINKSYFCSFQNVLKALHETHCIKGNQPMFTVSSGQVEILEKPIDFYINLHVPILNNNFSKVSNRAGEGYYGIPSIWGMGTWRNI